MLYLKFVSKIVSLRAILSKHKAVMLVSVTFYKIFCKTAILRIYPFVFL